MQPVEYKYYLRKYNGSNYNWYYVDASGVIQYTASGTPVNELQYAPDGWMNKQTILKRDFSYHSIFKYFGQPLRFKKDSRLILRNEFFTNGSEAELQLYIEILDPSDYTYSEYVYGEFDFSTFRNYEDDCECNLRDGGFITKLESRQEQAYEFPLQSNPDVIWCLVDGGPPVWCYFDFTGIEQPNDNSGSPAFPFVEGINLPTLIPFQTQGYSNGDIQNKGNEYIGLNSMWYAQPNIGSISLGMAEKYFIRNSSATTTYEVRIKGTLRIATIADAGASTRCRLRLLRALYGSGTIIQDHSIADGVVYSAGANGTEDIDFDVVITLDPNECLWLNFFYTNVTTSIIPKAHIYSLNLQVQFQNYVASAYVPVIPAGRLFEQLVDKISDNTTTAVPDYFDNVKPRQCFTSGDGLRRLSESQIRISFKDFYQTVNYLNSTSLSYSKALDEATIDEIATAYDQGTQILDFGEVASAEFTPLTDEMYSTLKIGWPNNTYDEINGKEEPNVTLELGAPMKKVNTTKDMVCPSRADMFGVILTIANLTNKTTADNETDNDVFLLDVDTSSVAGTFDLDGVTTNYYNLYRKSINTTPGANYYTINNVFLDVNDTFSNEDRAFNLFLTPKRMLFNNGPLIASQMYFHNSDTFDFIATGKSASGNVRLIVEEGATPNTYDEGSGESISALCNIDDVLYIPIKVKIKARPAQNIISLTDASPGGFYAFTWLDNEYYGFLISISEKASMKEPNEYELLLTPASDLTTLIT